jgi:hypothetical protein
LTPPHVFKRNIARAAGSLLAFFGAMLVVASCQDINGPTGLRGIVTIFYKGPPALDTSAGDIKVKIGERHGPKFEVMLGSEPQPRARYVYSSFPPGGTPDTSDVFKVVAGGDSIDIRGRGSDYLYATLLGATIGADTTYYDSVLVTAAPATNDVDSATVTLNFIGAKAIIRGLSKDAKDSVISATATSLTWVSRNPAVVSVAKSATEPDAAELTAVANSATPVYVVADFDNGSASDSANCAHPAASVRRRRGGHVREDQQRQGQHPPGDRPGDCRGQRL